MTRVIYTACLIASAANLGAQQTQSRTPFRAESRVVLVPVTVTDEKGRTIDGLGADDFRLLDNGTPRRLSLDTVGTGPAPVSLVIAIQSSEISAAALAKARQIGGMVQPLLAGARGAVAVLSFDREIHWLQDFTSDSGAIRTAFAAVKTDRGPSGRMLDAVMEATSRMKTRRGLKMILLISESRDRSSEATLNDTLDMVLREGVQVFSAPYSAYATSVIANPKDLAPPTYQTGLLGAILGGAVELARLSNVNTVQALAEATGASASSFATERTLENTIQKLGAEIHSQYVLSFEADVTQAGAHRIEVSIPDLRPTKAAAVKLRSRRGYWQDPPPETR